MGFHKADPRDHLLAVLLESVTARSRIAVSDAVLGPHRVGNWTALNSCLASHLTVATLRQRTPEFAFVTRSPTCQTRHRVTLTVDQDERRSAVRTDEVVWHGLPGMEELLVD